MDALPQNLFQLMLQLSRIQSSKKIMEMFLESMGSIFNEVNFFEVKNDDEQTIETIEIKTVFNNFGRIALEYGQLILPVSKKRQIYNAIDMLAILLENRKQQESLAFEKNQLKKEWIKQSENIHELDEQYKALAENSEDMILRFDKDFKIVYANVCTEKIFNSTRSFLIRKNIRDIELGNEQQAFWTSNIEKVFDLGISINENFTNLKNSNKLFYNVKFVPEKAEDGEVTYVFASARDITELKTKEKALYESQWHLNQAQRIAKIGSWEWNLKYNSITFSDEMYHILGLESKVIQPSLEELSNFIEKEELNNLKSFIENPTEILNNFEIELDFTRTDGQVRHGIICGEALFGMNGKIKKLHGTLQDITERKLLESDFKNAKLKAEESDKLKSAFLANMSHEIRTPLNGILGFSELLKRKNLSSEKRVFYTDIICSNGRQLLKIITDIIDISRIESNQIIIDKSNCNLTSLFNDLEEFTKTELQNKGIKNISVVLDSDPEYKNLILFCDDIHLKKVFINLLANAAKFKNSGYIRFGYEVKKNCVEFFVKDTGIGIKQEFHRIIFERFRQANESVSRDHGGTGLGLSISKKLVELMGGNIWLTSEEGIGSEFRFSLPANIHSSYEYYELENSENTCYSWPGKKILIVEDDDPSVQLLKETLIDSQAEIYHADDGEKALSAFQFFNPDIILMDIRLPTISGLEVIRTIRETNKDVIIIAITANAFVEDRSNCMAAGSDEYISKPVDSLVLLSKIEKLMNKISVNKIASAANI